MKEKMKRIHTGVRKTAAGLLAAGLMLSFAACGEKAGPVETPSTTPTQVFTPNPQPDPVIDGVAELNLYTQADNREYFTIPAYIQKKAYVGEKVYVAQITPSEDKAEDFHSYVLLGSTLVEVTGGAFRPEQAGTYVCVYGYTLNAVRYRFSYQVEAVAKDGAVFLNEPLLPAAFLSDRTYPLAQVEAYDYAAGKSVPVTVTATVNGQSLSLDNGLRIDEASGAEEVTLVWQAGDSRLEKVVPVVHVGSGKNIRYAELFAGHGWNSKTATEDGILLSATGDAAASFANPVVASAAEIRFSFGANDYAECISVTMTSCEDPSVSIRIGFRKGRQSEGVGKVVLNGTTQKEYLYTAGQVLSMRYNAVSNQFVDGDGQLLFAPAYDTNGNPFTGFPGGLVNLRLEVENVYGLCDVLISKLGTQTFNLNTRDLMAPAVYYNSFNSLFTMGEEIVITGIHAVDTVEPNAKLTVSLAMNVGKETVAVEGSFENGTFRYLPTQPGIYTLRMDAEDASGNTASVRRQIYVFDETKPQLTLDGSLAATAGRNETLTLPGATATDNETVTVDLIVIFPSGQMRLLERGESLAQRTYQVTEPGDYCFRYVATDASGNTTIRDLTVRVTDAEKGGNA